MLTALVSDACGTRVSLPMSLTAGHANNDSLSEALCLFVGQLTSSLISLSSFSLKTYTNY